MIGYNDRQELLLLPEEELAIRKAVARLDAPSIHDCTIGIDASNYDVEPMMKKVQDLMNSEGLYEVNSMLKSLNYKNIDWKKLAAVVEVADVQKASGIAILADHLDEFEFIPKVSDAGDLAHYLVDNEEDYSMNPEMEDYFDFSGFGEQFVEQHGGQFVDGGFLYCCGYDSIEELLEDIENEDEGITMEGM